MEENLKKSGYAAIVGRPNVGKSTLMNQIIGQKIAITSARPQTTRKRIMTVYTDEVGQIVFLDTPGLILETANKLGEYMKKVSVSTLKDADVILYLIEPSTYIGPADQEMLELLKKAGRPVILVINKADKVPYERLLPIMDTFRQQLDFAEIVPVSALKGTNCPDLIKTIFSYLPVGPEYYDDETVTDEPVRDIASEIIREKSLMLLNEEVPHGIAVVIDKMQTRDDGLTEIYASVICEKESHKGIIIGKGASMLKKIGSASRYEIERLIEGPVFLKLFVKVRPNWRDNAGLLRELNYREEK